MKNISIIFLFISGLLLYGCSHTLHQKDSTLNDRKTILSKKNVSVIKPVDLSEKKKSETKPVQTSSKSNDVDPCFEDMTDKNETVADNIAKESVTDKNNTGHNKPSVSDVTDNEGAEDVLSDEETAADDNEEIVEYDITSEDSPSDTDNNQEEDTEKKSLSKDTQSDALDNALNFCELSQELWQKGVIEKALEALDQAYSLILNVDTDNNPDLFQQKEDLRFMISKRILEIHASRHVVAKGNHDAIPIVINKHVQDEIDNLSKEDDDHFFINAYKRSGKYRPYILSELKKAGLPAELSWLPLIESGFTSNALSIARALGLWQFIPSTGYKFGLKRDKYIDERMDFEKSTKAAIAYLKELHQIFGDWSTVLAAYNCGEGKVLQVIREQNINYLDNFWDLYERLPRETARYFPRFLATLHMVNNSEKYGLDSIIVCPELKYETVTISKQVHIKDIAEIIDISPKILKDLNSELRYNILPDFSYSLRVPLEKGDVLLAKLDEIPDSSLPEQQLAASRRNIENTTRPRQNIQDTTRSQKNIENTTRSQKNIQDTTRSQKNIQSAATRQQQIKILNHKVKKGDTLSSIAKRYGVSVKKILSANKISKKGIVIGKMLKIPSENLAYSSEKDKSEKGKKNVQHKKTSTHVVKNGDSLWNIARRYGISPKEIHVMNKLRSTSLHKGQVLKIPVKGRKVSSADVLKTYRVKNGDAAFGIAKRHNMSLKRLLEVNALKNGKSIYPGQNLYVE